MGPAPAEETDRTTTTSETTPSETTTSGTTHTTGTTHATTTTTTTVEPVIFVTISNPGADIGSSVSVISDGRVLWAGVQSPTAGDVDGFVAGYWKPAGKGTATGIELHPLAPVAPAARPDVETEASALLAMLEPRADPGAIRWVEGA